MSIPRQPLMPDELKHGGVDSYPKVFQRLSGRGQTPSRYRRHNRILVLSEPPPKSECCIQCLSRFLRLEIHVSVNLRDFGEDGGGCWVSPNFEAVVLDAIEDGSYAIQLVPLASENEFNSPLTHSVYKTDSGRKAIWPEGNAATFGWKIECPVFREMR